MTNENTAEKYAQLFNLPENHTLRVSSSRQTERNSVVYEIKWLDEHNDKRELVARFRTWTNRSLKPPYLNQTGWERFSVSGSLLDREVRYSRRNDMEYIH